MSNVIYWAEAIEGMVWLTAHPMPTAIFLKEDGLYQVQNRSSATTAVDLESAKEAAYNMMVPVVTRTKFLQMIPFTLDAPQDEAVIHVVGGDGYINTGTYNSSTHEITSVLGPVMGSGSQTLWCIATPIS